MIIGKKLEKIRKDLKLTKVELSKITGINVKTIYQIETSKRKPMEKTLAKIKIGINKKFDLDISNIIGKTVWEVTDFDRVTSNIIEGGLLGDGSISENGVYVQQAKDKKYLEWLAKILSKGGIHCKTVPAKHLTSFSSSHDFWQLYSHTCPALQDFRKKWYIKKNGKTIKVVPPETKINPITLLHWYLGDGDLKRDSRLDQMARPCVRLHTEGFLRGDIEQLISKLNKIGLKFIAVPKLSNNKDKGYALYSDLDSVFKFFKIIGIESIREIKNCVTKIITTRDKVCKFKDKWPSETDWLRILAQNDKIGLVIKERREMLGINQRRLSRIVKTVSHHICSIESGKKHPSAKLFKRLIKALQLDISDILRILAPLR